MIISRKESWGSIKYDTKLHEFIINNKSSNKGIPYVLRPLVLNVDLTFKCNMACIHCVARDMENQLSNGEDADLKITSKLISSINKSPFMVVVITGGEALLKGYEKSLIKLIAGLKKKAIIIDTNGTITPSKELLELFIKKDIMVRVSWDSPNPREEADLRKYPKNLYVNNEEYLNMKVKLIKHLIKSGVEVAIQSVLHGKNYRDNNFYMLPHKLKFLGINKWYIQRYIPTICNKNDEKYRLSIIKYEESISKLESIATGLGIRCYTKKDRRHNSVFLLVKAGDIYTQSDEKTGGKILLGNINDIDAMDSYFNYVSASDHTDRYAR